MVDVHLLKTFVTLVETGSFSKTAETLFLTQPAVSKRIAQLESELGVGLIDRVGKKQFITEGGQELYMRAQKILHEVEDCVRALSHKSDLVAGKLKIATSHHIALHRLPKILEKFSSLYPKVELDIQFLDSEQCCKFVEKGDIEFGLATLPDHRIENLEFTPIWCDEMHIVVGRNHPLVRKRGTASCVRFMFDLKDIVKYPGVMPQSTTYTYRFVEKMLSERDLQLNVSMSSNYLETIKMLVSVGLGWSVLPQSMLIDETLICLHVDKFQLKRQLGVVMHKKRTLSKSAEAMLMLIGDCK